MKNLQVEKPKAPSPKLSAPQCSNNLETFAKTWRDKKKNHHQNDQQQR